MSQDKSQKQEGNDQSLYHPQILSNIKHSVTQNIKPAQLKIKSKREDDKKFNELSEDSDKEKEKTELPEDIKSKMEGSFGTDFSDVKIHKDSKSSKDLNAKAYTQGNNIHFSPGEFQPQNKQGQELIGHELAHVVQQSDGRVKGSDINEKGLSVNDDPGLEKEADEMGKKAADGIAVGYGLRLAGSTGGDGSNNNPLQKKDDDVVTAEDKSRAERIYNAISGFGTDEDAVYKVLRELKFDAFKINGLRRAYRLKYNETLDSALIADFSEGEMKAINIYLTPVVNVEPVKPPAAKQVIDSPIEAGERRIIYDKGFVHLRSSPDTSSDFNVIAFLKFNDQVATISAVSGGWAKVKYGSVIGYVDRTTLSGLMPAKDASLYHISPGDTLERMFYTMHYGTKVPEKSFLEKLSFEYSDADVLNDPRFFANAVFYLNNITPKKDPAVYMDGGGGLNLFQMATQTDYQKMKVKAGYKMWLPSKEYLKGLIGVIKPGSVKGNVEYSVAQQVDKYWADGIGVFLETGIGATFGIPVGVDGDQAFYALRQGNNIVIKAQYSIAAGLDTGVGAGLFFGKGKKDAKGNRVGIGAQAGANAEAKAKMLAYDEYTFPYKKPGAMASALFIALSKSQIGTIGLSGFMGQAARQLGSQMTNPDRFLTKRKMELGAFVKGSAEATLGVHSGQTDDGKDTHAWKDKHGPNEKASSPWTPDHPAIQYSPLGSILRSFMNIGISGQVAMEALGGVETNFEGDNITSKSYFQFTAGTDVALPSILAPIQALFPGTGGIAFTVETAYKKGHESNPIRKQLLVKIIKGSGNMDLVKGSGTEITLPPIPNGIEGIPGYFRGLMDKFKDPKSDIKSIVSIFNDMEIEKVMEFPVSAGGLERRLGRQQGVKRLLKDNLNKRGLLSSTGVNLSGILHVKFKLENLETKTDEIIALVNQIKNLDLKTLYDIVMDYYNKGEVHPQFQAIIDLFLQITTVDLMEVIISGSVGVAGGANVSKGLKLRLMGYAQGGVFHKFNLAQGGKMDLTALRELLSID
jgi:hypothetical protein